MNNVDKLRFFFFFPRNLALEVINLPVFLIFQDGCIDYNEFVAMMQQGNADFAKKRIQNGFSPGFREALPVF